MWLQDSSLVSTFAFSPLLRSVSRGWQRLLQRRRNVRRELSRSLTNRIRNLKPWSNRRDRKKTSCAGEVGIPGWSLKQAPSPFHPPHSCHFTQTLSLRNQTYLQLLCTLQNKPQDPEAKPEDKDVKGSALPPESLWGKPQADPEQDSPLKGIREITRTWSDSLPRFYEVKGPYPPAGAFWSKTVNTEILRQVEPTQNLMSFNSKTERKSSTSEL